MRQPALDHVYRSLDCLLRSMGEQISVNATDSKACLLLRNGTIRVECIHTPAGNAVEQIFDGHQRIAELMRRRGCMGRWRLCMERHFRDGAPIAELLACLESMPVHGDPHSIPACPSGITIAVGERLADVAEVRRRPVSREASSVRRPTSLIMNGDLSLYIEGPFFDQSEPMHELLGSDEQNGCLRVLAVESSGMHSTERQHLQELLDNAPPRIAGVLLVRVGSERQTAALEDVLVREHTKRLPLFTALRRRLHQ